MIILIELGLLTGSPVEKDLSLSGDLEWNAQKRIEWAHAPFGVLCGYRTVAPFNRFRPSYEMKNLTRKDARTVTHLTLALADRQLAYCPECILKVTGYKVHNSFTFPVSYSSLEDYRKEITQIDVVIRDQLREYAEENDLVKLYGFGEAKFDRSADDRVGHNNHEKGWINGIYCQEHGRTSCSIYVQSPRSDARMVTHLDLALADR